MTMMMLTYNWQQCQHVHTDEESTLVEELGRVHGFTRARQGVGSNRVRVRGGRRGYTGQGNARQRNGNGKTDDSKWESVDIEDHVDLENFVFAENEGLHFRGQHLMELHWI